MQDTSKEKPTGKAEAGSRDRRSLRDRFFQGLGRPLIRLALALWRSFRAWFFQVSTGVVLGVILVGVVSLVILFGPPHAYTSGHPQAWQQVFNLAGLIVFLGGIVAVIPVARHDVDNDDAFAAGLIATAALIPTTVTELSTVAAYAAPYLLSPWLSWIHNLALLIGASAGLVAWLFWGIFNRHLVTVDRQNAPVYAALCDRYTHLKGEYDILKDYQRPDNEVAAVACRTIEDRMKFLEQELGLQEGSGKDRRPSKKAGLRWVLATGYLNLWDHLHRCEEALLDLQPADELIGAALDDAQRLDGSNIPNRAQLLGIIRHAMTELSPESEPYFALLPVQAQSGLVDDQQARISVTQGSQGKGSARFRGYLALAWSMPRRHRVALSHASGGTPNDRERTARAALRYVRRTIDQFRASRVSELVRRRNHLLEAVIFTRITSYGLLGLAILVGAKTSAIIAATVFYLVGALIGLFDRLRVAGTSTATPAVEDYGFSSASLVQVTPFSGLAAVGGVLIVGLLGPIVVQSPAHGLEAILDLSANKGGIIIAAIFGLTPSLLITRLQQAAEQYKLDLGSTELRSGRDHASPTSAHPVGPDSRTT